MNWPWPRQRGTILGPRWKNPRGKHTYAKGERDLTADDMFYRIIKNNPQEVITPALVLSHGTKQVDNQIIHIHPVRLTKTSSSPVFHGFTPSKIWWPKNPMINLPAET